MAVSIVEFLIMNSSIMTKLDMAKKFHETWECALAKWELVGGKKEVEGMAVSIVEFLKMNSSIMAKLEMANKYHLKWESAVVKWVKNSSSILAKLNKFHLKWESALVKWELVGGKKEV